MAGMTDLVWTRRGIECLIFLPVHFSAFSSLLPPTLNGSPVGRRLQAERRKAEKWTGRKIRRKRTFQQSVLALVPPPILGLARPNTRRSRPATVQNNRLRTRAGRQVREPARR